MSFILDALRKSEHERHRQAGPALVEVAVAAPKPRANRWATAAIALLLINLVAIGVLLLFKSKDEPAAAAPAATAPSVAPSPHDIGTTTGAPSSAQATVTQTLPGPQVGATASPPILRPAEAASPPAATRGSLAQEMSSYVPPMESEAATAAARPPPGRAAVTPTGRGSVVYQSLPEAESAAAYDAPAEGSGSGLPRADEMTARGALPDLRLELHVWSTKPQERFVFVNGRRYREGDTTTEGATLEEITRDGVIMNASGNRFLLARD